MPPRAALICIASLVLATPAAAPAQEMDTGVDQFRWIAGHWRLETDGAVSEEGWFGPSGGLMIGMNRAVEDGVAVSFEYMRIEAGQDGAPPAYVAQPAGGPPVRFLLSEAGEQSAEFTNPDNDYPQIIRYAREGDILNATISDSDGENMVAWSWELMP